MKPRKQVKNGGGCKVSLLMAALCASAALTGAADVVQGLNAPTGAVAVDSGTTVLTNGFDATLPEALATNAVLWFSADKNVITNESGGVTEWRDVREAADAETRLYNAFQLFTQNGPDNPSRGRPYASTFFNNANFKGAPTEAAWSFISTYTNLVDNGDGTVTTNVTSAGSSCGICGSSTWFAYHRSIPAPGEEMFR